MRTKILIIDDEKNMLWALENALKPEGYKMVTAVNGEEGLERFKEQEPALILLDIKLPQMDGIAVLQKIRSINPTIPVIMMTAHGTLETAIQAMKLGATDYLSKPFDLEELKVLVKKALEYGKMANQIHFLQDELKKNLADTIIGESPQMKSVLAMAEQVATSDATVLISGESGTGKEVVADYIYKMSSRSDSPFIKVNCGALPETLLESELFGHEKGAFTGAIMRKPGRFERADGGTLFLDEIGEIPQVIQVKLLRVLQQKEFERVGGTETMKVDVRIITATNRNLKEMVKEGTFREDLFYRLNVIPIEIPALRERKEDIPLLIQHFAQKFTHKMRKPDLIFSREAMSGMVQYPWNGNIRELENMVERIVILAQNQRIDRIDLPGEILNLDKPLHGFKLPPEGIELETIEKDFIKQALNMADHNQTKTAQLLGITRHTLLYRMAKYGLK